MCIYSRVHRGLDTDGDFEKQIYRTTAPHISMDLQTEETDDCLSHWFLSLSLEIS